YLSHDFGARTRKDDFRPLRTHADAFHVRLDARIRSVTLARYLALGGDDGGRLADIDQYHAAFTPLDNARDYLMFFIFVFFEDVGALHLAQALDNHLFRRLRRHAAVFSRHRQRRADHVAELI